MGNAYVYSIFGLFLTFFDSGLDVLSCDWRRDFFKNGDGFSFFFVVATRLSFLQNNVYRDRQTT